MSLIYNICNLQEIYAESRRELVRCEQLVHDQHLQHQGWASAIANLDDIHRLRNMDSRRTYTLDINDIIRNNDHTLLYNIIS